jgi:Family of unknown function (DUF6348)
VKISYGFAVFGMRPQPWDPASGRRPSDDQLMELLRGKLLEVAPRIAAGSTVDHGILAGRAGWSLVALPNHTGRPGHFDIGFSLAAGGPVIADCISGIGPMATAVRNMLDIWAGTSGACFLAMADPPGESYAARLGGTEPAGIAGWHTIVSDIIGYGTDPASTKALQTALMERPVLRETTPALNRARDNGIKVYLHKTPTSTTGEVRVNGVPDVAATQALTALPWPDVSAPSTARFYAVALHRE